MALLVDIECVGFLQETYYGKGLTQIIGSLTFQVVHRQLVSVIPGYAILSA